LEDPVELNSTPGGRSACALAIKKNREGDENRSKEKGKENLHRNGGPGEEDVNDSEGLQFVTGGRPAHFAEKCNLLMGGKHKVGARERPRSSLKKRAGNPEGRWPASLLKSLS